MFVVIVACCTGIRTIGVACLDSLVKLKRLHCMSMGWSSIAIEAAERCQGHVRVLPGEAYVR